MESATDDTKVCDAYLRWARVEAEERSPRYAEWARGVAADQALCAAIAELEPVKRQPNLLFAAARFEGVPLQPWSAVRDAVHAAWPRIRSTMLARMTQTNEARRMATLLPAIAHLEGPIALVEVGASAGLCLYPDRWRYRFGAGKYVGDAGLPLLETDASPSTPLPERLPEVAWRGGIDLQPLDPDDPDTRAWLEALVWPDASGGIDGARVDRVRTAIAIARRERAHVRRGDLSVDTRAIVEEAARHAPTVVVWHSAVLAYVSAFERAGFADLMAQLPVTWVANEGATLEIGPPAPWASPGGFVLRRDAEPLAITDPHGGAITWLDDIPR
ncbi:DUF2332 domain-containing protein [Agrococcus carbonis]|uniref:DUF2332 domain-containing protein n=1 Tax=Agrococcus carbonis TaxID=684552 RepID=A0A1H1LW36_9MICO|nr:DUF2332 domain-containing protein [Agrococcus carbonis]SDR78834.1 hypothetical protein SAMN04489719_0773 [Agrococcus carbonis]